MISEANFPLPKNVDAERAALGAMTLDNSVIAEVRSIVHHTDFAETPHQLIAAAIYELHNRQVQIEIVTLMDYLKGQGQLDAVGGFVYLAGLEQAVLSTSGAPQLARIVREKAQLRAIIDTAVHTIEQARSEDTEAAVICEATQRRLIDINIGSEQGGMATLGEVGQEALDWVRQTDQLKQEGRSWSEWRTGLEPLDAQIGGVERGSFLVLAARPSVGKTSLAIQIADDHESRGIPVAIFSQEETGEQVAKRFAALASGVPTNDRTANWCYHDQKQRYDEALRAMGARTIEINKATNLTTGKIATLARSSKMRNPELGLIVVDYLQLLSDRNERGESREQLVSRMSRGLKQLAIELRLNVLCLSQLSRSSEKENRPPRLSDLRDSGGIEQDADLVVFLHRPNQDMNGATYDIDAMVAKNRRGPVGTVKVRFLKSLTKFVSPQD